MFSVRRPAFQQLAKKIFLCSLATAKAAISYSKLGIYHFLG